jgi:hypothetical protein
MGDIADAMLDGDLCQYCGVYMEGGAGYPQTCAGCQREAKDFPDGRNAKVKCPICQKTVKAVGLKDHTRDAHSALIKEGNPT